MAPRRSSTPARRRPRPSRCQREGRRAKLSRPPPSSPADVTAARTTPPCAPDATPADRPFCLLCSPGASPTAAVDSRALQAVCATLSPTRAALRSHHPTLRRTVGVIVVRRDHFARANRFSSLGRRGASRAYVFFTLPGGMSLLLSYTPSRSTHTLCPAIHISSPSRHGPDGVPGCPGRSRPLRGAANPRTRADMVRLSEPPEAVSLRFVASDATDDAGPWPERHWRIASIANCVCAP